MTATRTATRTAEDLEALAEQAGPRARERLGPGHHASGRPTTFGERLLRHLLDGRRGARPPRLAGRCPASTWCSSTPATTSPRPSAPATRSQAVDGRQPASRSPRSRRVAEQDADVRQGPATTATPTCAARCARSSRSSEALAGYDAWATGLRRAETPTRANTPVVGWDAEAAEGQGRPRSPAGRDEDVDAYIAENGVLVNPLLDDGYPSIGCAPCTRRVAAGEDARAGRWAGLRQDRVRDPPDDASSTRPRHDHGRRSIERSDGQAGATLWLTGLPCAGKTTIAHALADRLRDERPPRRGARRRRGPHAPVGGARLHPRGPATPTCSRIGCVAELLAATASWCWSR